MQTKLFNAMMSIVVIIICASCGSSPQQNAATETPVQSALTSTLTNTATPTSTITLTPVPPVKPLGTGPVRVRNRTLETDFDGDGRYERFPVQGAAFSPVPIGCGIGDPRVTPVLYDRSLALLAAMHADTIRTYGGTDPVLLRKAAAAGIRVIVGYWVPLDMDLSDSANRKSVLDGFVRLVAELKDEPGVLLWNIGNEQNWNNGNTRAWYSLVQELAVAAYGIEGPGYHPVCASNGGFSNIGDAAFGADDASLTYMDLWCSNDYKSDFTPSFNAFRTRTTKPIVLTEFGIDALDHRTRQEYEAEQESFDGANWSQILAASDVCAGGTVFEFTDEWWKAGDPLSHDFGGGPNSSHPDGYSNEEWWGLVAVTPDTNGDGLDEWRPRRVYYMFQRAWT